MLQKRFPRLTIEEKTAHNQQIRELFELVKGTSSIAKAKEIIETQRPDYKALKISHGRDKIWFYCAEGEQSESKKIATICFDVGSDLEQNLALHQRVYAKLLALIPKICSIQVTEESYLLYSGDEAPLNVLISEQSETKTVATLCRLPTDKNGNVLPDPYIEMVLCHSEHIAFPTLFADRDEKLVWEELSENELKRMDIQVCTWLEMMYNMGFRPLE